MSTQTGSGLRGLVSPEDPGAALALMTVLPIPGSGSRRGALAAWAWPLAGLVVALVAALGGWILQIIGMTPALIAAAVLALQAILTGALHEDGLADSADGLFGGRTVERRLEIMKDSRAGSFGVLALVLVTLARWSALTTLIAAGDMFGPLIGAAVLSRAALPVMMVALPPARNGGVSRMLGVPPRATAALGLVLALGVALLALGWALIPAAAAVGVMAVTVALVARERIGGQTGDILGAAQQLAELGALAALVAAL